MEKLWDDSNWREEYKPYVNDKMKLELLNNGPTSLSQSWILGAMYGDWKKMKGYKDPEPPNCQSSMTEYFQKEREFLVEDYDKDPDGGVFDDYTDPYGGH